MKVSFRFYKTVGCRKKNVRVQVEEALFAMQQWWVKRVFSFCIPMITKCTPMLQPTKLQTLFRCITPPLQLPSPSTLSEEEEEERVIISQHYIAFASSSIAQ